MTEPLESGSFNPFRAIAEQLTREKAAVRAARRDEHQAKAAPLLAAAGLLEACTPDELMNAARKQAENWDRTDRRFVRFARLARYFVSRRVTPEELGVMDRRRAKLPKSPAYGADFWRRALGNLCGRDATYRKRHAG